MAFAAQLEFEFGQGSHYCRNGAPRGSCGVNAFSQGTQHDSALAEFGDGAGDLRDATAEPIDRTDDKGVACAGVVTKAELPVVRGAGCSWALST